MIARSTRPDDEFTPPGMLQVSPAALKHARDFSETIKNTRRGDWIPTFDWAQSVSVREGPNEPSKEIGACLMLGALRRSEIPSEFLQTVDGLEFVISIPVDVLKKSTRRLIDIDESVLFKLVLL